jgi:hypothetical protein
VAHRHTEVETFGFLTGDFECAWDALAARPEAVAPNRGNFMFALQSTVLLEWLSRLCASDSRALSDFALELQKLEPKYFTELHAPCLSRRDCGFAFPGVRPDPLKSLLAAVWDLIRNGQAHHYHDIIVKLADGKQWALGIEGVTYGWPLSKVAGDRPSLQHLSYRIDSDEDLVLLIHPGALFLDIRDAARNSRLLNRGLTIQPFGRGGHRNKSYQFDRGQLELALASGGHSGSRLPGSRVAARPRPWRSRGLCTVGP